MLHVKSIEIGKKENLSEAWKEYKKSRQNAKSVTIIIIIIFRLPQPLYGCWYLLCQGSEYFSQP